jgi:hypothetical protein
MVKNKFKIIDLLLKKIISTDQSYIGIIFLYGVIDQFYLED